MKFKKVGWVSINDPTASNLTKNQLSIFTLVFGRFLGEKKKKLDQPLARPDPKSKETGMFFEIQTQTTRLDGLELKKNQKT